MKNNMKWFVIGSIFALLLNFSIASFAQSKNIDAKINEVKVTMSGTAVESDTILYNGKTYIPVRKFAKLFNRDVIWDAETQTAHIIQTVPAPISIIDPEIWTPLDVFQSQFGTIPFVESTKFGTIFSVLTAAKQYQFRFDENWFVRIINQ